MNRIYDIREFADKEYDIKLATSLDIRDTDHFLFHMGAIEAWGNQTCSGKFLILANRVLFTDEQDALMFKLKFG